MELNKFDEGCNPRCRGCSHRGWTMQESLAQKQSFVEKKLAQWSDVVKPIVSVEEEKRWGYRTSVTLSAAWIGNRWFFGTKSMDEVIPIHQCPVHHPLVNKIVETLTDKLPSADIFPLAFLVVTKAQCVLIVKGKSPEKVDYISEELIDELKVIGVDGFWIHFNPSAGRRLFEKGGWVHVFGNRLSTDSYGLWYGSSSFQQQIQELYHQTLDIAEDFLNPDSFSYVFDLYCGTGTSLRRWRKRNVQCVGVETSGEALECASLNAPGAILLRGSCMLRIPQLTEFLLQQLFLSKKILMYVNPPRTGIESEVLEWITKIAKPQRIAYLSCSPGTLSKNVQFLTKRNYSLKAAIPFDFFPQTHHVECLALFEKEVF